MAPESEASATHAEPEVVEVRTEERENAESADLQPNDGDARVDDFDALVDKWLEPKAQRLALSDVDDFVKRFRRVPKGRRTECVHRAMNLIPDENVMLLVGILMDKTLDVETVKTVFGDILNRDEAVKKPILLQVLKDKTHPCRSEAAWILDVTGELPQQK